MSPGMSAGTADAAATRPSETPEKPVEVLLVDVLDPLKREEALLHLSQKRQSVADFALFIWYTPCIISLILQEIVRVYPYLGLSSPSIPKCDSSRVCNALSLLQSVAADCRVKTELIKASIPQYLYPFMLTRFKAMNFEFLRLTSLGVIGALIKEADIETILFLLQSEVVPACLRSMDVGSELSKTAATIIMEKILSTDLGLHYICDKPDRFFAVNEVFVSMINCTDEKPTARLIKRIVSCYLLVSSHPRIVTRLYEMLPDALKDETIIRMLQDDAQTVGLVQQLLSKIKDRQCANGKGK